MIYLLIALQVVDAISTIILLQRPGFVERNKLLAKLFDKFGIVFTLLVIKGGSMAWLLYFQDQLPMEIIGFLCAVYVWVVYNNLKHFGDDPIS